MRAEQYLDPSILNQVARLDLKAKFMMQGFLSGLHASPFKGFSVEFSEHRKYVPGDDVRLIDWKVYARTNRHYVKCFQAETNLQAMLLVDASASMGYGSGEVTKLEYATYLAAALTYLMISQQDPVGLVTFSTHLRELIKPKSTRKQLMRVLKTLSDTRASGRTRLAAALHEVAERVDKRGLIILLSDLLDDPDETLRAIHHLRYRGHDMIVFQILDADETRFPFEGAVDFEDMESGAHLVSDAPAVRAAYLDALHESTERYRRETTNYNVDYVLMDTATRFDKALTAYLIKRTGR